MIERDEIYEDEVLLYKPTAKKKKPKKSKHKHRYEYCVFEIVQEYGKLDPVHGFVPVTYLSIGTYCPICGKIGHLCVSGEERWYKNKSYMPADPTAECLREYDAQTRTLPFFRVEDYWQKEVEIG